MSSIYIFCISVFPDLNFPSIIVIATLCWDSRLSAVVVFHSFHVFHFSCHIRENLPPHLVTQYSVG